MCYMEIHICVKEDKEIMDYLEISKKYLLGVS